ncbi:MAG: TonB-dependent receptor [Gemmatimonadetes bacterium]|nr:TonB-dependent receptor [Gemmatimonadota bacterium]
MKTRFLGVMGLLLVTAGIAVGGTINGYVRDKGSAETLPHANAVLRQGDQVIGVLSNAEGYYALKGVPAGSYSFIVSYIGYESYRDSVTVPDEGEQRLDVSLNPETLQGQEIVVEANRAEEEERIQTGFITLETAKIQDLPSFGEADILRSLPLLPGIQAASDISSGLYIRGGGPDQTLILLDQIPLYNPSHAFGFFSTFNSDAIKDMSLHKGAYPAQYGGRLGSVLDVRNRDGNRNRFQGTGGVSLISGRLTLEGPTPSGSWMVSGRRTYMDPLLSLIRSDSTDVPTYYFFDVNAKLNQDWGDRDKLTVSAYLGRDDLGFDLEEDTFFNIRWGNTAGTAKWNHLFTPSLYGNFMVAGSKYFSDTDLNIFDTPILISNSIRDVSVKGDLDYFATSQHTLTAGVLSTWYDFRFRQVFNQDEQLNLKETPSLHSVYLQDHWQPTSGTSIRLGVRGNYFTNQENVRIEPRISLSQQLRPGLRFKAGGGSYTQYLQLVTTEAFSGSDFWVPLDDTVDPGESWQAVGGFEYEPSENYRFSLEGYYTDMANLVVIDQDVPVDSEGTTSEDVFVTRGTGYATGVEFFLQKRKGRLTGWIGYTLGWTRRTFEELNGGREFPVKYDRRHDVSFVLSYRKGKWTWGANLVYGTGQAFTPVVGRYALRAPATSDFQINRYAIQGDKNSSRLLPYHRLDLSMKRKFNLFGTQAEWYLQVFNVYNRRNEWFVENDNGGDQSPRVFKMLPIVPTVGVDFGF